MMKTYTAPEMELSSFDNASVMLVSATDTDMDMAEDF